MYSDFMKKKVVNIWGTNFSSAALKKSPAKASLSVKASVGIKEASTAECAKSKDKILKKEVSAKKSNF